MRGIERFKDFAADFGSVASIATKLAIVFPLADLALKLGPPQPPGIPFLTSAAMLLTLILIFHFWAGDGPQALSTRLIASAVAFCAFSMFYVIVKGSLTDIRSLPGGGSERVVVGYEIVEPLQSEISAAAREEREREAYERRRAKEERRAITACYANGRRYTDGVNVYVDCPSPDSVAEPIPAKPIGLIRAERVEELISAKGDPAAAYTRGSRAIVSVVLLVLWIGMFAALVAFLGTFVLSAKRPRPAHPS